MKRAPWHTSAKSCWQRAFGSGRAARKVLTLRSLLLSLLYSHDDLKLTCERKEILILHIFTTWNDEVEINAAHLSLLSSPFLRLLVIFGTKSSWIWVIAMLEHRTDLFSDTFLFMRLQGQQNSNNSLHIKFVLKLSLLCFLSSSIIEKPQTHFLKSLTSGHTTLNTAQGASRAASKRICVRAGVCQQHIVCIKCLKEIWRPNVSLQHGEQLSGCLQRSVVLSTSFESNYFLNKFRLLLQHNTFLISSTFIF